MQTPYDLVIQDLERPLAKQQIWGFGIAVDCKGHKWVCFVRKDESLFQKISFLFNRILGKIDCSNRAWVTYESELGKERCVTLQHLTQEHSKILALASREAQLRSSVDFLTRKKESLAKEVEKPKKPLDWLKGFADMK